MTIDSLWYDSIFTASNLSYVIFHFVQDGISYLAPLTTKRKMDVCIQDFCNMMGGGLVSYNTLTADCINALNGLSTGIVICSYLYNPDDVVLPVATASSSTATATTTSTAAAPAVTGVHRFYIICWKGNSRAINVMCGKVGE